MNLRDYLEAKVAQFNRPNFIENDPIAIPHQYQLLQDIEIAGFFAAILAWGQRKTIINKCKELMQRMDNAPYDFVKNHTDEDLKSLLGFKHRTFNDTDLLYFVSFFKQHYQRFESLEDAFVPQIAEAQKGYLTHLNEDFPAAPSANTCYQSHFQFSTREALNHFRRYFFSLPDFPHRTQKHISSPQQKSTCKRLNMYLRWMVRKDTQGVDFGLWHTLQPSQLICPCDVHVDRVARQLQLITRKQTDWQTAVELTEKLSFFDKSDPVKYDFALFGIGVEEKLPIFS